MDAASLEVLKVMLDGGFEQPDVLARIPVHGRRTGTRLSLKSLLSLSVLSYRTGNQNC